MSVMTEPTTPLATFMLAAFENVLADTGENLHFYSPEGGVADPAEAQQRLITLLADGLQAVASGITDAAARTSALSPAEIVEALRARATELDPESVRRYDPQMNWDDDL